MPGNYVVVVVLSSLAALVLLLPPLFAAVDDGMRSGGKCTNSCGNVGFEYPFGVEDGCYRGGGFNLTCNHTYQSPRLFLGDGSVQVLDISVPHGWALINNTGMVFNSTETRVVLNRTWDQLVGGPYSLSGSNKIALVGCNARVDLRARVKVKHGGRGGDDDTGSNLISSCTAVCPLDLEDMTPVFAIGSGGSSAACSGVGCCQADINLDIPSSYTIQIHNLQELGGSISPTDLVFISKEEFSYTNDMAFGNNIPQALPALLDWYISSDPSECTYESAPDCLSANSFCHAYDLGYKCHCSDGYQGNPYIRGGCHDIDECGHRETYQCYGECINFPGGFDCLCYHGTDGDPRKEGGCLPVKHHLSGLFIGLGVGSGTILLLIAVGAPFLSRKMKVRKLKRMRQTFFNQNHGLLLQRLISQNAHISERMILTLPVLEKATNNFDRTREVGGGGHGIVYKGILNLEVVAIKKSMIIVEREINDFINEVAILSQINHRNVVKLIGCCLETEVPLLVYEFISNGSLDQHFHVDEPISLSWKDRMRIAVEVARALTYLHSAATVPVFHRDIKACNILLDN
ncbi:Os09g0339300 [Oryza sativa Japonica Group]|uniref:Os09g0339300 protein n=1 Tax=Oryza sativa subsp. japonica TaxID=39947 RepID=A0A0P0XLK2_ORYSJ|nr:Os09g0339300 [Oryza sativa Japonica Group]